MLLGYLMSCGTRFYDVLPPQTGDVGSNDKLAAHPVIPSPDQLAAKAAQTGGLIKYLAEPPFVPPPDSTLRKWNYWMMSQRAGTLSYLTFAAGLSLVVYIAFFIACDLWKLRLGFFQTFGTNALLAYVLHSMVGDAIQAFGPKDSPAWYAYGSLILFFSVTWLFVRSFEKQGMYLRV